MRRSLIACLVAVPVFALAQAPSTPAPERPAAESAAAPALPVRRVILYKTGVGYFEHLGNVRNRQNITIRFTSAQLNDVLNSLTVLDLGKGQITGISYNSVAPLEQRLGALRLPLDESTTQVQMLGSLRGARVEVTAGTGAVEGRLLSVEQRTRRRGDETTAVDTISVVTDGGELRTFELSPTVRVRIVERDLRQEIGRYLDLVGSTREQDVRSMVISTAGTGERPLFVSYVSEVPIWKSTYRLVAAASLGDLFEYRIKEPITLRKNQSALVPIVSAEIEAEKVSLWNRSSGSGRPLRAVWLTNATGLTLDGGSMTLIDGDAFAGEGLLEPLKPGEKRLLSYAADLGVMVDARRQAADGRILRLRARDGIITQETEERVTWTYKARNENATPTTLIIEHRMQPGWKLADGQTPVESTVDTQRFRVSLPPAKETVFEVRDLRQGETRIMIGNVDDLLMAQLAQAGISAAALEKALKPVLDKKAELAGLERRVQALQNERNTIGQDQQRLRENMKALRGSAEEKQLLQRYTRQLDEQETRLETLQTDIARITTEMEKTRGELGALIGSLSFDLTAR